VETLQAQDKRLKKARLIDYFHTRPRVLLIINLIKIMEKNQTYYLEHKEKIKAQSKKWREDNPEKYEILRKRYVKNNLVIWKSGEVCSICQTSDNPKIYKNMCRRCYDKKLKDKRLEYMKSEKGRAIQRLSDFNQKYYKKETCYKNLNSFKSAMKTAEENFKKTPDYQIWKKNYYKYQYSLVKGNPNLKNKRRKASLKYYFLNKEVLNKKTKKLYKDNIEFYKDYAKKHYYKNREKYITYSKNYYIKNREKLRAYYHQRYLENKKSAVSIID
jgi:hypothetical protein